MSRVDVSQMVAVRGKHTDLDHVAIAVQDVTPALRLLVGTLGGAIRGGGTGSGFRAVHVTLGTESAGMTIEVLEPWNTDANPFLRRFLAARGEGAHHITFTVPDLRAELPRFVASGFHPVAVDLRSPHWKEAFLHPREVGGTVIQLAQDDSDEHSVTPWWPIPPPPARSPAVMRRAVLSTRSIPDSQALFVDLLRGTVGGEGRGWLEVGWPGGGTVRLEENRHRSPAITRLECDGWRAGEFRMAATTVLVTSPSFNRLKAGGICEPPVRRVAQPYFTGGAGRGPHELCSAPKPPRPRRPGTCPLP